MEVLTTSEVTQALGTELIKQHNGQDTRHGLYLTVYWDRSIKADHVENYGHKGGHARNGVYL